MGNCELHERLRQGKVREVSFDEFSALVGERGFRFDRATEGSWVFAHPALPGSIGVQSTDGKIQAFQALYLLRMLEEHDIAAGH